MQLQYILKWRRGRRPMRPGMVLLLLRQTLVGSHLPQFGPAHVDRKMIPEFRLVLGPPLECPAHADRKMLNLVMGTTSECPVTALKLQHQISDHCGNVSRPWPYI